MKKLLFILMIYALVVSAAVAKSVTLTWGGQSTTVNLPDEVADMVKDNQKEIESALAEYNVTPTQVTDAVDQINTQYTNIMGTNSNPITAVTDGLNDFTDVLTEVLPNSQLQQNVWAKAWIGRLLHMGFGVNAGVTQMDISSLKTAANALEVDTGDISDNLIFPTITADIRLGGIVFPFDVGLTFSSIDSNKLGLEDAIDPVAFDFFTIGGDVRYCFFRHGPVNSKVSATLGAYYTKGSLSIDDDGAGAGLDFKSTTFVPGIQASAQLLCFVPFVGAKLFMSKTKAEWYVDADWTKILDDNSDISDAATWGILPSHFSDSSSTSYFGNMRPVLYGGLGLDLFILDLTVSGSYDIINQLPSAALSVRLAL